MLIMEQEDNELTPPSKNIDTDRVAMTWSENLENMLIEWKMTCESVSTIHFKRSKRKKRIHYVLSIPCIFVPLFMSFTNQFFGEEHLYTSYMNSVGYLISGGLIGLSTFLDYSAKYVLHEVASSRYVEICLEIDSCLIKKRKFREKADVIIERLKNKIECLNKYSISI